MHKLSLDLFNTVMHTVGSFGNTPSGTSTVRSGGRDGITWIDQDMQPIDRGMQPIDRG